MAQEYIPVRIKLKISRFSKNVKILCSIPKIPSFSHKKFHHRHDKPACRRIFPAGGPAGAGCKASFYKPIPAFVTNLPAYITIL